MNAIANLESSQKKTKLPSINVGDTVKIHQRITEGKKSRVQIFEGLVIRYRKTNSLQAFITVRKIASGVGVEKSWFVHNPTIEKIQVVKRSKVRRAFLSYMRDRRGKSARLAEMGFDRDKANESDHRTKQQLELEEQEKISKEVEKDADTDAQDDVMNQPDTQSTESEAKKEVKAAKSEDPSSADDDEPTTAPEQEKVNASGNDEQQLAAEEAQEGVDKKK
ncbi:MAG: large subunit ribosomal protein [Patescibacteria group bacterium]|jgi:large subunit ribosomal protein L19|nr:large subunit ribosomal protein [Patescibacteria group bacterium]